MAKVLVSPNGALIIGTRDVLEACAHIQSAKEGSGGGRRFEIEYVGQTEVDWDSQTTELDGTGERLFEDSDGAVWAEGQLRLIDEEELEGQEENADA